MEAAIQTVVSVFLKSSKGKENLGGKDFQNLVKNQLSNFLTDTENNKAIKDLRDKLDGNQDGKVSFQEYMLLVGFVAQSISDQRGPEEESQAKTSTTETHSEAAATGDLEPEAEPKPTVEKPAETHLTEEKKPEEEKNRSVEAKAEEKSVEEKNKSVEAKAEEKSVEENRSVEAKAEEKSVEEKVQQAA